MNSKERTITGEHPFAGWMTWQGEPFDEKAGPFYHRIDNQGRFVAALRVDQSHLNGLHVVHGGCLVTLADYAMFSLAAHGRNDSEFVTISLNSEFIGAAREEDLVVAYPEIIRRGSRILFMRGLLSVNERPVLSFSGAMMAVQAISPNSMRKEVRPGGSNG